MGSRPNFCQLLGLNPLNEAKYTAAAIQKRIAENETKWTNDSNNKQNDTQQRFKVQKLVAMVPEIKEVMSDPMLKKKEFMDGKALLTSKGQKLKTDCVVLTDGSLLVFKGTVTNFLKQIHWKDVTEKDIVTLLDLKENLPKLPSITTNVENAFKGMQGVDCFTVVEVLNALIDDPNLEINTARVTEGSSPTQIRNAFELCEKRVNNIRPGTLPAQDSYIQTLRAIKLCLDKDSDLAALSMYGRCQQAMAPVTETMAEEYSRQFTRKYIDDLVKAHMEKGLDYDLCLYILETFCFKKKIPANFSRSESTMSRCPHCGGMVERGPATMFCPACGKKFNTVCPKCGTAQDATNSICVKCGLNFKDAENKAAKYSLEFRQYLGKGKVSAASRSLAMLKDVSPGYNGINMMEKDLAVATEDLNSRRKMIMDASDKKMHFAVKTMTEELMAKYPDAVGEDSALSQRYSESVSKYNMAEQYCSRAKVESNKVARMGMYVAAVDLCRDHQIARSKLREDPPMGPSESFVYLDKDCTCIKFGEYADPANTVYCIYRSRGDLPIVTEDAKPLAEVPATTAEYVDRSMDSGVEYFYAVHTKRFGVLSRENFSFGPIFVSAKVSDISIEEKPGQFRIIYKKPRGAYRVRAWRSLTSKDASHIELGLNDQEVYDDYVPGGAEYKYTFVAEYKMGNQIVRSDPVVQVVEAHVAPKPVNNMEIMRNDKDGSYNAKWNADQDAILYHTSKRIPLGGNSLSMDDVNAWMKPVDVIEKYEGGVTFSLPDGAIEYVYPITPMGKLAVRGKEIMVSNARPFRDIEHVLSGKDCVITMVWPEGATSAKIVVSNDSVKSLKDAAAEVHTVKREQYLKDRQIRISMGQQPKRCFNAYAVYNVEGTEVNSRGVAFEVYSANAKKVRYTVKAEKTGVRLDFQTDADVTQIPQIVGVQVMEGIPLKKTDGEAVFKSNGPVSLIQGKATLNMACKKTDIEKMRLFFVNDSNYNLFRFVHPLYGRRD